MYTQIAQHCHNCWDSTKTRDNEKLDLSPFCLKTSDPSIAFSTIPTCSAGAGGAAPAAPVAEPGMTWLQATLNGLWTEKVKVTADLTSTTVQRYNSRNTLLWISNILFDS